MTPRTLQLMSVGSVLLKDQYFVLHVQVLKYNDKLHFLLTNFYTLSIMLDMKEIEHLYQQCVYHCRGSGMCELRCYLHPPLEAGRERPLPLQRLRPLLQDERHESTARQAQETSCKYTITFHCWIFVPGVHICLEEIQKEKNELFPVDRGDLCCGVAGAHTASLSAATIADTGA